MVKICLYQFQTDHGENRGVIELTEIDEMGIALFKRIFTYFKPDKQIQLLNDGQNKDHQFEVLKKVIIGLAKQNL